MTISPPPRHAAAAASATTATAPGTAAGPGRRRTHPPTIAALCLIELRKLVDTRVSWILIAVGALLVGAFGGGMVLFREQTSFSDIVVFASYPVSLLAPVLAVLLVTAERSHRTELATFALVPHRGRVWASKLLAVIALAIGATALTLVAGLLIAPVGSLVTGADVAWDFDSARIGIFTLVTVISSLSGFALALLIGSGPAVIVLVLAWPTVAMFLRVVPEIAAVLDWVDVAALGALPDDPTGVDLAKVAAGIAVWVVVPGVIGWMRRMRDEVRA
ncbi:MAG: hypothetical protein ACTH31_04555 [Pseudoclavibacter sp.]